MEKNIADKYKTGYSTSIKFSTMELIEQCAKKFNIPKADVGRRILEFFFEHNDIEDIKA